MAHRVQTTRAHKHGRLDGTSARRLSTSQQTMVCGIQTQQRRLACNPTPNRVHQAGKQKMNWLLYTTLVISASITAGCGLATYRLQRHLHNLKENLHGRHDLLETKVFQGRLKLSDLENELHQYQEEMMFLRAKVNPRASKKSGKPSGVTSASQLLYNKNPAGSKELK